jgi:hypothetical protein
MLLTADYADNADLATRIQPAKFPLQPQHVKFNTRFKMLD